MAALTPTLFKCRLYWEIGKELNRPNWVGGRVSWDYLLQSSIEEGPRGFNIDGIFRRQVWILLFSGVSQFCSGGKGFGVILDLQGMGKADNSRTVCCVGAAE